MKTFLNAFSPQENHLIFLNENPSPSPTTKPEGRKEEKLTAVKQTATTELHTLKQETSKPLAETAEQHERKKLEQDVHGLAGDVVQDVRLWKDEKNYDAKEIRSQFPKIKQAIQSMKNVYKNEPAMLTLLKRLPLYLNPGSLKDSITIKEGFHHAIKGIAIDYTEDVEDIVANIQRGMDEYVETIDTIKFTKRSTKHHANFTLRDGTYYTLEPNGSSCYGSDYKKYIQLEPYMATRIDILEHENGPVVATLSTDQNGKLMGFSSARRGKDVQIDSEAGKIAIR